MQLKTVNVVEVVDGKVTTVRSWAENEKHLAEVVFVALVEENEIALHGKDAGLDTIAARAILDEGMYDGGSYHVALVHSQELADADLKRIMKYLRPTA